MRGCISFPLRGAPANKNNLGLVVFFFCRVLIPAPFFGLSGFCCGHLSLPFSIAWGMGISVPLSVARVWRRKGGQGNPQPPPLGLAVRSICIAVLLFFINCRRRFLCPTIENGVSFFACFFWLSLEMIAFCECVSSGFEGGTAPYHWPPPPQNVFSAGARRAADCIVLRGLLAPPPFRVRQNENAYRLGVLSGWPPPGRVGQRWRISWRMGLLFSVASVSWIFFRPPPLFF